MTNQDTTPVLERVNPLLARIKIPGETVRLPSGALFYTHGELASNVKNGEVHVHPLSTYDEIVLKSPDKLVNGTAIEEVFRRCIPEVEKPLELFAKDVDYLVMALRKATFGPKIELKFNHHCKEEAKDQDYTADISTFMAATRGIDPTKINDNYHLTLPNDQKVVIVPTRFKSVVQILQDSAVAVDNEVDQLVYYKNRMISTFASVVDSVDGITDRDQIWEWLDQLNIGWIKMIQKAVEKSGDWGPDTTFNATCKDCNQPIQIEIPLNPVTFFT